MTETEVGKKAAPKPVHVERRAFPRLKSKAAALWRPNDQPFSPGERVKLVDISQGGVGLLLKESCKPGDVIQIELDGSSSGMKMVREAEVRWTAPDPSGMVRVGCCWKQRLSYAEFMRFI